MSVSVVEDGPLHQFLKYDLKLLYIAMHCIA